MRWIFSNHRQQGKQLHSLKLNVEDESKSPIEPVIFDTSHLENWHQRCRRLQYIRILLLKNTVFFLFNAVTLPQTWSYLKWLKSRDEHNLVNEEFVGHDNTGDISKWWSSAIVSITPLLRLFTSPLAGWLSDRYGYRLVSLTCDVLVCLGAVFWSIAPLVSIAPQCWLLISRALMALCGGQLELLMTYIATATIKEERRRLTAQAATSIGIGTVLGPALLTLFSLIGHKSVNKRDASSWQMNTFTASSLGITIVISVITILSYIAFTESNLARHELQGLSPSFSSFQKRGALKNYNGIFICLMIALHSFGAMRLHETLLVAMTMEIYGWNEKRAINSSGLILLLTSILAMAVNNLSTRAASHFGDRPMLLLGLVFGLIAALLGLPIEKASKFNFIMSSSGRNVFDRISPDTQQVNRSAALFSVTASTSSSAISNLDVPYHPESSSPLNTTQAEAMKGHHENAQWLGFSVDQGILPTMTTYLPFSHLTACVILTGVSCSVLFTSSGSLYSHMDYSNNHALHWGLMGSAANLGRAIYPFSFTYLYDEFGPQVTYLALVAAVSTLLLLTALSYGRIATENRIDSFCGLKREQSRENIIVHSNNKSHTGKLSSKSAQESHLASIIEGILKDLKHSKQYDSRNVDNNSSKNSDIESGKQVDYQKNLLLNRNKLDNVGLGARYKHNSSSL